MRLRVLVGAGIVLMLLAPTGGRAEPFASFWSMLSEGERAFVDRVAAGLYAEERGERAPSYDRLNVASKARLRARAIETLGVENRPARANQRGIDV